MSSFLPSGWAWASVGETGQYINGFAFKPSHWGARGKPIIRIQNLTDDGKPLNRTELDAPAAVHVAPGEMLVSWSATLDVFIWRREPALLNQHIFRVIPDTEVVEPRWLFHALRLAIQQLSDSAHLHGSTMAHINRGPFLAHRLPMPPRGEQVRIADQLDEVLSDLDSAATELRHAQKKLTQCRQSLLKAAVEGALTADWRAQNPPKETGAELLARILRERRARWEAQQLEKFNAQGKEPPKDWAADYAEPTAADAVDLPVLPPSWVWASAEQLCGFITKGTTPPKGGDEGGTKTVPFLRVTNLTQTGALDFADRTFVSQATHTGFLARSRVVSGDVLMNIVGPPLGQVSLVPTQFPEWNINQAIAIFRPVAGVSNLLLRLALLSPLAQGWLKARAKTTAGQTNLTLELCRALPLPLPPIAEQVEIARLVDEGLDSLAALQSATERSAGLASAQRQNILRAAFSGQLVPQDPNDEPASVLLERIRAERASQPQTGTRARRRKSPAHTP